MSLNSNILNTYKQFGFFYFVKGFFKRLIAPIVKMTSFYILAIENHTHKENNEDTQVLNIDNLDDYFKNGINLNKKLKQQLLSFLPQNTFAVLVLRDMNIAGWGYVQQSGMSKYGGYNYHIPIKTHLLKNLFVEPDYRGQSIGKIINQSRINNIPEEITPIVFVIRSNNFAIRNLEMYGFSKQVFVKDYLWFNKYHARSLKVLGNKDMANLIISGFKNE